MEIRIVDASAIGAVIFNETPADEISDRLDGASLLAPWLLPHELDSICAKKIGAQPQQRRKLLEARSMADKFSIVYCSVMHQEVVELALQTRLTTYDASYLWLAKSRNLELVTLDVRLGKAAASWSMR